MTDTPKTPAEELDKTGPLAWFAQNSVAANVVMIVLLLAGAFFATQATQEVFPEVQFEIVIINVPYPGASPAEVEQGVILATEEAIRDVDGIKQVRSTAQESFGVVVIELLEGKDPNVALADVKSAVDRITSYPEDTERPAIFLATNRTRVISLVLYGNADEKSLRALAETARLDLMTDDRISTVEMTGVRVPEISIEVPPEKLEQHGLTLASIAQRIRAASVEVPGGAVKTHSGELLLRTAERRTYGQEFEDIILKASPDGTIVTVGSIGVVIDGFQETERDGFFDGFEKSEQGKSTVRGTKLERAVMLDVFRIGEETPIEVADAVHDYMDRATDTLPPGIKVATWFDMSKMFEGRIDLLKRNAFYGLILVLLVLGMFLEVRLAFWVTLGIPISFIGAMLFLPTFAVSINMISLFAFIVVLGMVVDDAIIVGEAIYYLRQKGMGPLEAAIKGVRSVAMPVCFAVITTMIFFTPLLYVPGFAGKFFRNIPLVVIAVLIISLFESLFILPAHLAHSKPPSQRGFFGAVNRAQSVFGNALDRFVKGPYQRALTWAIHHRYITMAIAVSVLLATAGLPASGMLEFSFMPRIEADTAVAMVEFPYGTPAHETKVALDRMVTALEEAIKEVGAEEQHIEGVFSQLGATTMSHRGGPGGMRTNIGSHIAEVAISVVPSDEREHFTLSMAAGLDKPSLTRIWKEKLGDIPGVEALKFRADTGGSGKAPLGFRLYHQDARVLEAAASDLARRLESYAGVFDVDDGFSPGKEQLDIHIKPEAKRLGLTELDVARQVRAGFFGAEALRQQRGRDEVRVYVRYPKAVRHTEYGLETMRLRTPAGGEIPLAVAARLERGHADMKIRRTDGRRRATVTADIDFTRNNPGRVVAQMKESDMPELEAAYPGLTWTLSGEQENQKELLTALRDYFFLAILAIIALLAMAFRSYIQPFIIVSAIPFGIVGAVLGHLVMGFEMSIISMMGLVALSGVVVNDSLIFIVAINEYRKEGMGKFEAVIAGGVRRFRPILLTSLTTFFGLAPMILEPSMQARFLIPMAVSLGFGVMFATVITLVLVPSLYLIAEDAHTFWRYLIDGPAEWRDPRAAVALPES